MTIFLITMIKLISRLKFLDIRIGPSGKETEVHP